jgi:hypothetical protein
MPAYRSLLLRVMILIARCCPTRHLLTGSGTQCGTKRPCSSGHWLLQSHARPLQCRPSCSISLSCPVKRPAQTPQSSRWSGFRRSRLQHRALSLPGKQSCSSCGSCTVHSGHCGAGPGRTNLCHDCQGGPRRVPCKQGVAFQPQCILCGCFQAATGRCRGLAAIATSGQTDIHSPTPT